MIRQKLLDYMKKNKKTQEAIGLIIGYDSSSIGMYLKGMYKSDPTYIEQKIKAFLDTQEEKLKTARETNFVETSVFKKIREVAKVCHRNQSMGLVCGRAGVGKTFSVKQYVKENEGIILIEADTGYTARNIFIELHQKLGMSGRGRVNTLKNEVIEKLKGTKKLIIIDEAEYLPYKALELLRRIYDKAGVGVLLVGLPKLLYNLKGSFGQYEQLYSRIEIFIADLNSISEKDVLDLSSSRLNLNNKMAGMYFEYSNGSARRLDMLIKNSLRLMKINKLDKVTSDILCKADEMVLK